ncbi:hypothetical protein PIB30_024711 [Stylosanthes scabra]|uniref:Uncharacterized protein n=1 Tax=Stylosanthes scabra TaxID=79078 RepID=A0ABU6RA45_9FABA|nr:hypothetical protein [Stylosanthes scabra]
MKIMITYEKNREPVRRKRKGTGELFRDGNLAIGDRASTKPSSIHVLSIRNIRRKMMKIGEVWGRVMRVQEGEGGHFNSFWVLVDSNVAPMIQAMATMVIEGESFLIVIREVGGDALWILDDANEEKRRKQKETLLEIEDSDRELHNS